MSSLGSRTGIRSRQCATLRLRPLDILHKAEQLLPQSEMSLTAQKQLAKGYESCDTQHGGSRKVVQLEAVELQEPPEKRMNWKSEPSYQIRDKAYPLSLGGIGKALRLLSAIIGGKPSSIRDQVRWGKKSLGLKHH